MQLPDLSGLRVHRSAARDRRSGGAGADTVPVGTVPKCVVPVLWTKKRPDQRAVLGGDGFVLVYKRLESGSFQWPGNGEEARQLTPQQYRWLMEGLSIEQPKAHKPMSGLRIV